MKKTFLNFTVIAGIAATLLSGCGKDNSTCSVNCGSTASEREAVYLGTYKGNITLQITVGTGKIPVPVPATFTVVNGSSSSDDSILITSAQIGSNTFGINAAINTTDCKNFTLKQISVDTLVLSSLPSTLAGGLISNYQPLTISNFSATGAGSMDCDAKTLSIDINIVSGKTNSPNSTLNNLDISSSSFNVKVVKQ